MPLLMEALGSSQSMNLSELTLNLENIANNTIVNLRKALDI